VVTHTVVVTVVVKVGVVVALTVDVISKVEERVLVDVVVVTDVVTDVRSCSFVTHAVLVCLKTDVTSENTCVVIVDVSRIVWVVTIVAALSDGTLYTATYAVPAMITIPMINTLTKGDIPFLLRDLSPILTPSTPGLNPWFSPPVCSKMPHVLLRII